MEVKGLGLSRTSDGGYGRRLRMPPSATAVSLSTAQAEGGRSGEATMLSAATTTHSEVRL